MFLSCLVRSNFWFSHFTSLSCRVFCESILKKKKTLSKDKKSILSQQSAFLPSVLARRILWLCLFEIHISSLAPFCFQYYLSLKAISFLLLKRFKVDLTQYRMLMRSKGCNLNFQIWIWISSIGATLCRVLWFHKDQYVLPVPLTIPNPEKETVTYRNNSDTGRQE